MNDSGGCIRLKKDVNGVKVFAVRGDLTVDKTPQFHKICQTAKAAEGTMAVLLDFGMVGNIDTTAFACMLNFMREYISKGARAGIVNLDIRNRDLLGILKIGTAIRSFDSEDEAIKTLSGK